MNILVVGGDSADIFRRFTAQRHGRVEHWSGRKTRDGARPIPKHTNAVVLVLDRVSHGLAGKIRREASHRGLTVYFRKRGRRTDSGIRSASDTLNILFPYREPS